MWDYNRLNKQKEAQCEAENITDSRRDEFKDMGDSSPLFRWVSRLIRVATFIDECARYTI
jgi:hypothetical protein